MSSSILQQRKTPEDILLTIGSLAINVKDGTIEYLRENIVNLDTRLSKLRSKCIEYEEYCEDAKQAMQIFHLKEAVFISDLTKLQDDILNLCSSPKLPIGNVQQVIDDHMVFLFMCLT